MIRLKTKLNRSLVAAAFGALLTAGVGLGLHNFKVGTGLVQRSYDLLTVARGDVEVTEAVMVYLDEDSFLKLSQPLNAPWDRSLHARLIERLTSAGARAVVFDIVFNDPNPNNPAADEQLAKAARSNGHVFLAADYVTLGPGQEKVMMPFDLLRTNAAGVGSAELEADSDLIIREYSPGALLPSMSWVVAEALGAKITQAQRSQNARRWMSYYGPPSALPWKSYHQALDPAQVADDFFRNKVVFVGSHLMTQFAGERKDQYPSPFSSWLLRETIQGDRRAMFMAGVEVQATALLNLLRGDWLTRLPFFGESAVILILGLLFGAGLIRFRPIIATAIALTGLVLVVFLCVILFWKQFIWFPWLIVVVQIAAAYLWSVLFNSIQLYVQKRLYEYTLGLYLSPKLVKKFSADPNFLKPGADELTITIVFTDIADFTELSQGITSDALAQLMNQYFHNAVSECIHKTDGTVVKYIGDAIFAFWNAPEAQTDHAFRACEAALRFREQSMQPIHGHLLRTRIGVHTGLARVGNFGSPERVDYTALGENVNLASRLEGLNKYLSTDCLISKQTKDGIGDRLVTRPLGLFTLKGFDKPVGVHEIVGWPAEAEATRPWREAFAEALNNYEQRNQEFAEMGFRRVLELKPGDGPSKFYLEKLDELRTQSLPEDWATHTILREK